MLQLNLSGLIAGLGPIQGSSGETREHGLSYRSVRVIHLVVIGSG